MLITDPKILNQYNSSRRVWQGIPGIAITDKGRIFISLYSGDTKETYGNFAMLLKSDDGINFTEPIAVAKKIGKFRCFDPVLWNDPLNRLWFIWNVMPGEEVMASICEDPDADVLSWTDPFHIGRGVMMNKPIVLSSGEWIFPIAIWKLYIYDEFRSSAYTPDDVAASYVYKTSDNGKTFIKLGGADIQDRSFDEHMVVELKNGSLMMLVRTNYGIGRSYSYNRGKTWSRGEKTELGGPCSRFFIGRLKSGRIILINHVNFKGRNNLTALLSEDEGKTFPYSILLDERNDVSYPDVTEDANGSIYIIYDRERGCFKNSLDEAYSSAREILLAKITEDDIISGKLVNNNSYLKRVVNKLEKLADGEPDPYSNYNMDNDRLLEELIQSPEQDIIELLFERYPINCVNIQDIDAKRMDKLIDRFNASNSTDLKALGELIRLIRSSPTQQNKDSYPLVEYAKAYVKDHSAEDFSVAEIAEQLHSSVYYLAHLFKTVTGITILEYRNELRLTKAKMLLIQTELDIAQIAEQTGFDNASYFTEMFTKSETIPPTLYRKYHGETQK